MSKYSKIHPGYAYEEIDTFDKTMIFVTDDYKNKYNIGYAFVNFMDCSHVASFCKIHCREWQRFKSHKICAVKYGRIQGKLNLIQHFKSTNVVKEASMDYRPLLFYSSGPQMGHRNHLATACDELRFEAVRH